MNLCMNGTIESGVETLRVRVEYNMGAKGGSEFVQSGTWLTLEITNSFGLEI
jgi:hypothetical protein